MSVENLFQALESRRLLAITLSGGTLTITGGASADVIQIDISGTNLIATLGKTSKKVASASVTRVSINTLAGNDFVSLGRITQPATILGGDGNDTLTGGEGTDSIDGQNGNDYIDGRGGNDTLKGSNNNDTMNGGAGDDQLDGLADGDLLNGGTGSNTLSGGAGIDQVSYSDATAGVSVSLDG